ncbi:MAG: TnpV protein [Oscillospiraceae bacterium]|nr:TnpV protein [Oscillospiraceae bacterium]MBP3359954.1 TnpV protein [Clostridia bacterium]
MRYTNLLTAGKLNTYLAEIDERAQNVKDAFVKQMVEHEDVNEMLKEQNQMEWVQKMNNIRNRAEEIINNEIIFN